MVTLPYSFVPVTQLYDIAIFVHELLKLEGCTPGAIEPPTLHQSPLELMAGVQSQVQEPRDAVVPSAILSKCTGQPHLQ